MLQGIEGIFQDMQIMMKKLKKATYEKNMNAFLEENRHYFDEMAFYVAGAEDKEKAAGEIAKDFADKVEQKNTVKGRINGRLQADMNFFMIYYVFPAVLMADEVNGKLTADAICREWGARFKDSKIGYADYDTIYGGFREKIFGIF